jgi:hypothetical protein
MGNKEGVKGAYIFSGPPSNYPGFYAPQATGKFEVNGIADYCLRRCA